VDEKQGDDLTHGRISKIRGSLLQSRAAAAAALMLVVDLVDPAVEFFG